jgi:hypothetical protein
MLLKQKNSKTWFQNFWTGHFFGQKKIVHFQNRHDFFCTDF